MIPDASIVVKWFVHEPMHVEARRLIETATSVVVPDLLYAEVGNVLWRKLRLGQITREQAYHIPSALHAYVTEVYGATQLLAEALRIAHELDHPIYDCIYLALADRTGNVIQTADRRFAKAVTATRWAGCLAVLEPDRPP